MTQFHFHNLTGYILDDASCAKLHHTLELLREVRSRKPAVETLRGRTTAGPWQAFKATIDIHGVVRSK